jgi:hypothetical protein
MKKVDQLTFLLFIFSIFAFSYPVTQVFAEGGGRCDPDPRCVASDRNAIPCCSSSGGDVRDPRGEHPPLDTRDPRGGDVRDPRAAAPSEDTRGGGLSKREMIQACKKQYGKKKKNKAAKQACIAAAKGR